MQTFERTLNRIRAEVGYDPFAGDPPSEDTIERYVDALEAQVRAMDMLDPPPTRGAVDRIDGPGRDAVPGDPLDDSVAADRAYLLRRVEVVEAEVASLRNDRGAVGDE